MEYVNGERRQCNRHDMIAGDSVQVVVITVLLLLELGNVAPPPRLSEARPNQVCPWIEKTG